MAFIHRSQWSRVCGSVTVKLPVSSVLPAFCHLTMSGPSVSPPALLPKCLFSISGVCLAISLLGNFLLAPSKPESDLITPPVKILCTQSRHPTPYYHDLQVLCDLDPSFLLSSMCTSLSLIHDCPGPLPRSVTIRLLRSLLAAQCEESHRLPAVSHCLWVLSCHGTRRK